MKFSPAVLSAVLLVFFCGCASREPATLKIGMSKEEVSKIMGEPRSTDNDGEIEYWNYAIKDPEPAPPTLVFVGSKPSNAVLSSRDPMSRYTNEYGSDFVSYDPNTDSFVSSTTRRGTPRRSRLFSFTIQFAGDRLAVAGPSQVYGLRRFTAEGFVQILSGTVSAHANTPALITLKVRYKFRNKNEGLLQIAFNVDGPDSYRVVANQAVKGTEGEMEISATITPKDWGEAATFNAVVFLREGTLSAKGDVIALKKHVINLTK